jgi:hypothetical protein
MRAAFPVGWLLWGALLAQAGSGARAEPRPSGDRTDFGVWFGGLVDSPRARALLAGVDRRLEAARAALDRAPAASADRAAAGIRLERLFDLDRALRSAPAEALAAGLVPQEIGWIMGELTDRAQEVDRRVTRELELLLAEHDWFSITAFGPEADKRGLLLLSRAGSAPGFQLEVLARLERLVFRGETSVTHFAELHDAISVEQGRPQRYGTQGRCAAPGAWEPAPLEAPEAELEARRRSVLLPPLAELKARLDAACAP